MNIYCNYSAFDLFTKVKEQLIKNNFNRTTIVFTKKCNKKLVEFNTNSVVDFFNFWVEVIKHEYKIICDYNNFQGFRVIITQKQREPYNSISFTNGVLNLMQKIIFYNKKPDYLKIVLLYNLFELGLVDLYYNNIPKERMIRTSICLWKKYFGERFKHKFDHKVYLEGGMEIPIIRSIELMGCFYHVKTKEDAVFIKDHVLQDKTNYSYNELIGKRIVLICDDIIKDFLEDNPSVSHYKFVDVKTKVIFHEFGHACFCDIENNSNPQREVSEKRANFICSLISDGFYDDLIEDVTNIQPEVYKHPYYFHLLLADSDYNRQMALNNFLWEFDR